MSVSTGREPFSAPGETDENGHRIGVLLSHGFTGSPVSMRAWGEACAAKGYAVEVPLLPGHGTTWQDLNRHRWSDWYGALERSFLDLRGRCDAVVVGGLSMGGGLALALAARHNQDVAGVMLVNPAVASRNKQLLALPVLQHVVRSLPGIVNDIKKPGQDEQGYDRLPLKALHSLVGGWRATRTELPRVTAPLLLLRSAEDHVVDDLSSQIIVREVSSRDVTQHVLADSYHVATLDNDAPFIVEESLRFLRRVTAPSET